MEIRELCQNRWDDIHRYFGVDEKFLNKRNQPCPLCGGKDRARYADFMGYGTVICNACMPPEDNVDGFEFLERFTGKSFKALATDIRGMLGETTARVKQGTDVAKVRKKLTAMWRESQPLSKGCPAHLYLLSRGLKGLQFGSLTNLRCHPALPYWHQDGNDAVKCGEHPAMVGMVTTPDNEPATLHITYLQADGRKAAVENVRKTMTPAKNWDGGAIRLEQLAEGQTLCVAEGIETALSMKLLYADLCPWACVNAGKLQKFIPPNDYSGTMYIAADADISHTGQAAAYSLAKRLSGKHEVHVLAPEKLGMDFNDVLNQRKSA